MKLLLFVYLPTSWEHVSSTSCTKTTTSITTHHELYLLNQMASFRSDYVYTLSVHLVDKQYTVKYYSKSLVCMDRCVLCVIAVDELLA